MPMANSDQRDLSSHPPKCILWVGVRVISPDELIVADQRHHSSMGRASKVDESASTTGDPVTFRVVVPARASLTREERKASKTTGAWPVRLIQTFAGSNELLNALGDRPRSQVEPPTKAQSVEEQAGAKLASAFGALIRGVVRDELAKVKPAKAEPPPPPPPTADGTIYIRAGEAARMLNVSTRTIRHYISKGWLRAFRVGRPGSQRLLLSKGDVIDFVERAQTLEKVPELSPQVDAILAKINSDAA